MSDNWKLLDDLMNQSKYFWSFFMQFLFFGLLYKNLLSALNSFNLRNFIEMFCNLIFIKI